MNLFDTGFGETHHVALRPARASGVGVLQSLPTGEVRLHRRMIDAAWVLEGAKGRAEVQPGNPQAEELLRLLVDQPEGVFASLEVVSAASLTLHVHRLRARIRDDRPHTLHIPPEVQEKLPLRAREDLNRWWEEEMSFFAHGERWLLAFFGKGAGDLQRGFDLCGASWRFTVKAAGSGAWLVDKAKQQKKHPREVLALTLPLRLVVGRVDIQTVYASSPPITEDLSPFLSQWRRYRELEAELVEKAALELGEVEYVACRRDGAIARLTLRDLPPQAWARPTRPVGIQASSGNTTEPLGALLGVDPTERRVLRVELDDLDADPPAQGRLSVDNRGDGSRLDRQKQAMERLTDHSSHLPDLLDVLEGRGRQGRADPIRQALSPGLLGKLDRALSPGQAEAVALALNTPDLAVIQGPPGTGKTTVIRALVQRLHEEGRRPVLVCSHQHEAVLNVIEDLTVNGLPVPRIGGRRGEDLWTSARALWSWLEGVAARAEENAAALPGDKAAALRKQLWREVVAWEQLPADEESARSLVYRVQAEVGGLLSVDVQEGLNRALRHLTGGHLAGGSPETFLLCEADRSALRTLLNRQRRSPESWEDDGPEAATRLQRWLSPHPAVAPALLSALQLAAAQPHTAGPPPGWEALLAELESIAAPPAPQAPGSPDPVVREAVHAALADLDARATAQGEGLGDALLRLSHRLRAAPELVQRLLEQHTTVLSSTTSQSASKAMTNLHPHFDTLIVDEAARANPLDLLIPLVRARRIILVGDQMQLPHLLEPTVEEALEAAGEGDLRSRLAEGLFQRLWSRYNQDPPGAMPRCLLLNRQFRMHPVIGNLVSQSFYGGSIENGVEAADRPPVEALSPHPVAWWDVPRAKGPEQKSSASSRFREAEVEVLIERLAPLLAVEDGLSIGIISFYAAQVGRLAERVAAEGWEGRVSVGTVDAFQGRDFDVVLLSTVRCEGSVGFLALPNRMNVAMSRARRFLGVVGDRRTASRVPSLGALLDITDRLGTFHA